VLLSLVDVVAKQRNQKRQRKKLQVKKDVHLVVVAPQKNLLNSYLS
jgi:hypothetical protein